MSDLELTMMRRVGELKAENARLKAEVERLDTLCKQLGKQHSDISCDNIMLRKAGDLLAVHYTALSKCVTPNNAKSGSINDWTSVIDWNAAKETPPHA